VNPLRSAILAAARSDRLRTAITAARPTRAVVDRFVAGETSADALRVASELVAAGCVVSLDHLGEDVTDASEAGRAVILSSAAAHRCRPFWGPYSASKAAVEALARTWAGEAENTPLRVTSVDPGATRTAMRAQAMPGEDPDTLPHPRAVAQAILPLVGPDVTETGKLFVVRENKLVDYRMPE